MAKPDKDGLDKVIAYLQKREGIDKTLKLLRYTSRLVVAVSPKDSEVYKRYSAFEKSLGVSRKTFRLGKFLQDFNNLRKSKATGFMALLELVAYSGEGIYFFVEQFVWLIKAGFMDKKEETELTTISAWSEFVGYMANIWISLIKLRAVQTELKSIQAQLDKAEWGPAVTSTPSTSTSTQPAPPLDGPTSSVAAAASPATIQLQLKQALLQAARRVRIRAMVQDLADSTLALNDIRGGKDRVLGHPITLAVAGLISGIISAHKNWIA